jgi:hypothetical protein
MPATENSKAQKKRDLFWKKVKGEMCSCGHLKTAHFGPLNHGYCVLGAMPHCTRYTWSHFVDAKGKRLDR